MAPDEKISVLMICLGNICRSPMAEAIFRHVAKENGLESRFKAIDSAGTGNYHTGQNPDPRAQDICNANGVDMAHSARQVKTEDFRKFDYILAMDRENLEDLEYVKPKDSTARVMLFGDFYGGRKKGVIVEDPYYGRSNGFQENYEQCVKMSEGFMKEVLGVEL